eukprot:TRINITY_DN61190_c0_g1_i1.p1 TRINITY_DN61190_c0_g1~~TRINITY_DN61190_c0_g1_i1.p1  ORF type:complete len:422 (+),score=90.68 TRINITY_DN61190_c0_g1_i1:225-1490(+)
MSSIVDIPRNSGHLEFRAAHVFDFQAASLAGASRVAIRQSMRRGSKELPEDLGIVMRVLDAGCEMRLPKLPRGEVFDWDASLEIVDKVIAIHRRDLRSGLRVLELGCGLGIPSMVCAALGSQVTSTDLASALDCVRKNASVNGFPQEVWEVVGSKRLGGVLVQEEMGLGDLPERLGIGSLVEQVEHEGNHLQFTKLRGEGPHAGWVKLKRWGCEPDLVRTLERPSMHKNGGELRVLDFKFDRREVWKLTEDGDYDVVICCDAVYEPAYGLSSYVELAKCLEFLCSPSTVIYLALTRRVNDGIDGFLHLVRSMPLLKATLRPSKSVPEDKLLLFAMRRPTGPEVFNQMLNRSGDSLPPPGYTGDVKVSTRRGKMLGGEKAKAEENKEEPAAVGEEVAADGDGGGGGEEAKAEDETVAQAEKK